MKYIRKNGGRLKISDLKKLKNMEKVKNNEDFFFGVKYYSL